MIFASLDSVLNKFSIQSYITKDIDEEQKKTNAYDDSLRMNVTCSHHNFGRDPAPGQTKYCFCGVDPEDAL